MLKRHYGAVILWFDHFLDSGAEFVKFFVVFFENLKNSKRRSEINWPLKPIVLYFDSPTLKSKIRIFDCILKCD